MIKKYAITEQEFLSLLGDVYEECEKQSDKIAAASGGKEAFLKASQQKARRLFRQKLAKTLLPLIGAGVMVLAVIILVISICT